MVTNIRISLIVIIMVFTIRASLHSQTENDTIYQYEIDLDEYFLYDNVAPINFIELGVSINIPQAAFKRYHPGGIGGLCLNYSRQIKAESPLFIGGSISYGVVDSYSSEVERDFGSIIEFWDGSTTSSLISFDANAKYFIGKPIWIFDLYTELSLGSNWFFTNTTFSFPNSEESDTNFEGGDMVLAYGGYLGLMAYLKNDFYLDLAFGYSSGLSSEYFVEKDKKDPILSSTIQGFERKKSTTDMIRLKIGVNFAF